MCGKDIDFVNDFKSRYQHAFDEYIVQLPGNLRTRVFVQDLGAIAKARQHFKQLSKVALDVERTRQKLSQYINRPINMG
ncbi:hypothetical protein G7043_34480 [Lentzea sp. NEAU-D13]|uniref:Uncharacterized protein n=1 Tax=Lentzea alba TaxID=2714351 RepID=A0A7C9W5Z0_9PSEU|nr:hypothetical protein [Lentzea alba]NGY64040.1 hypothetical protein [Lentzea alba]